MNLNRLARIPLASVLFLISPLFAGDRPADSGALGTTTAEAYMAHVKLLASDELGGRGTGSEGNDRAAAYIAEQLQAAGCVPGGVDGGWYQPFEVRQGRKFNQDAAAFKIDDLNRTWQPGKDLIPFPFTANDDVAGPLAFAGFGIEADEYEYNDYRDFDPKGKILLMFRYEPKAPDETATFGGKTPSRYALFERKVSTAFNKGAKGVLIVNPPSHDPDKDALYAFESAERAGPYELPMVHISREMAGAVLKAGGLPDLQTLEDKLTQERKPLSKDLNLTADIKLGVEPRVLKTQNVLGLLKGDGSTDELVVVGAHFDHLGTTPRSFQRSDTTPVIHNGADDNASGTAGIIEIARLLGRAPKLRRGILFIAFSGEEMGLLGSKHFVDHPTVELDRIKAMINLDMIGRLGQNKFEISGVDTAAIFDFLVRKACEEQGIKYTSASRGGPYWGASDHASFYRKNIPVLFAFTGVHKQYHQPEDDWELIDADGAARIVNMLAGIVREIASLPEAPAFVKREDLARAPDPHAAAPADPAAGQPADGAPLDQPAPQMPKVRLGIVPSYSEDEKPGLVVDAVAEGGAAKEAGVQDGDRIVRIGDKKIANLTAYMRALADFKPGDTVEIVVERQGQPITLKATLKGAAERRNPD